MNPRIRYPAQVAEDLDIAIIGAGPAGLAAGNALLNSGLSFAVFEAGVDVDSRNRLNPQGLTRGVGGAGLYSDGKFSFHPSASALWNLRDTELLKDAYRWLRATMGNQIQTPEFPELDEQTPHVTSGFKAYRSIYVPFEARQSFIGELASNLGKSLRTAMRVVAIRETSSGSIVHLETRRGVSAIRVKAVIFAGGRFGPLEMSRIIPDLPMVFRRFEIGIRLEQKHTEFIFKNHQSVDVKHIESGVSPIEEWRTFCTCRNGEVVETKWDSISAFSGRADGDSSGLSNIGVNLRFLMPPDDDVTAGEIFDILGGRTPTFDVPALDFLHGKTLFLGSQLDGKFRQHLTEMCPSEVLDRARLYGPCVEGVGYYPDVNETLKINSHEVWVAGDCAGLFRGLTAALLSGFYVSLQVMRHLRRAKEVPKFVKGSPSDPMPIIFTAQSKAFFYCRDAICEYVFKQKLLPVNPFRVFEYFLGDRVDRDIIRQGNNQLIATADELWVFGPIADGVLFEIVRARHLRKPVRFFSVATRSEEIKPLSIDEVKFEPEVHSAQIKREDLLALLSDTLPLIERSPDAQLSLIFNAPEASKFVSAFS
jgi:hypothetical protein